MYQHLTFPSTQMHLWAAQQATYGRAADHVPVAFDGRAAVANLPQSTLDAGLMPQNQLRPDAGIGNPARGSMIHPGQFDQMGSFEVRMGGSSSVNPGG